MPTVAPIEKSSTVWDPTKCKNLNPFGNQKVPFTPKNTVFRERFNIGKPKCRKCMHCYCEKEGKSCKYHSMCQVRDC